MRYSAVLAIVAWAGCTLIDADVEQQRLDPDGDGVLWPDDCDDNDATIGGPSTWYADNDGDTFGVADSTTEACTLPQGYAHNTDDCNDDDPAIHPDGVEICDDVGVDEDCDNAIDDLDDDVTGTTTWYRDDDGDQFGDEDDIGVQACLAPKGYVDNPSDCDDTDPAIHPDGVEICDDFDTDEDCDGDVDDQDPSVTGQTLYYPDGDGDDFGDEGAKPVASCELPDDHVEDNTDCDDSLPEVNPDELDVCGNGLDNDCDPTTYCRFVGSLSDLENEASAVLVGPILSAEAAHGLGYGDFDNDGSVDLLIGAPLSSDSEGRLYVVNGPIPTGSFGLEYSDASITGPAPDSDFGYFVAGVGDINGDGYHDALVGAPNLSDSLPGDTFLFHGPFDKTTTVESAAAQITSVSNGDNLGTWVDSADVDDDGFQELVVGSAGVKPGGAAYLFETTVTGHISTEDALTTVEGPIGGLMGYQLSQIGDINGDGTEEIAVVAPTWGTGKTPTKGAVFLLEAPLPTGTVDAEDIAYAVYRGEASQDFLGTGIDSAGDVDGDGTMDMVLGSPWQDTEVTRGGAVYVVVNPDAGDWAIAKRADISYYGNEPDREVGWWCNHGDLDLDGTPDLMIGAPGNDVNGTLYVEYGPLTAGSYIIRDEADGTFASLEADQAGLIALAPGDISGDGGPDIVIGAPSAAGEAGHVYLLFSGM